MNTISNQSESRPKISEQALQASCYQWAYNTYPQLRGLLFSVPNGGTRNMREAQVLKATGLTPGIPDMILLYPNSTDGGNGIHAFEFKSATGRLSEAQVKIHARWQAEGINVYVITDEEEFKRIIKNLPVR